MIRMNQWNESMENQPEESYSHVQALSTVTWCSKNTLICNQQDATHATSRVRRKKKGLGVSDCQTDSTTVIFLAVLPQPAVFRIFWPMIQISFTSSLVCTLHCLPYRITDPRWWGKYCNYCWHATTLFPIWHRFFILYLEDALRSIPGCQDWELIKGESDIPFFIYFLYLWTGQSHRQSAFVKSNDQKSAVSKAILLPTIVTNNVRGN